MKWGDANLLHLMWILIPLVIVITSLMKRKERRLQQLFDPAVMDLLIPRRMRSRSRTRLTLWICALGLCILALARPQWGYTLEEVKRRSMEIIVVLDTSNSMLATDIKPNRLQQAKWGIQDLVGKLKTDRVGLVAFAGGSFLQCPLTIDYAAFLMTLDDIYPGIIPRGGTAITQALRTAVESFEQGPETDRAIILITDGEDHEGDPMDLLDELKAKNVRVYCVGVGTMEGELIPNPDKDQTGYMKNEEGEIIKTALQERSMERLALSTDGIYVRSAPGDFGLERIVDQGLSHLKRDETESRMIKSFQDRYLWALLPAFVLLMFEAGLGEMRRKPRKGESTS